MSTHLSPASNYATKVRPGRGSIQKGSTSDTQLTQRLAFHFHEIIMFQGNVGSGVGRHSGKMYYVACDVRIQMLRPPLKDLHCYTLNAIAVEKFRQSLLGKHLNGWIRYWLLHLQVRHDWPNDILRQ